MSLLRLPGFLKSILENLNVIVRKPSNIDFDLSMLVKLLNSTLRNTLVCSSKFLCSCLHSLMSTILNLRYMILATTTVSTFVKYVFYVSDMLMEGQWEKKPIYTFYLEFVRDLLHLSMYLCFFLVIFM
jgi:hypothetical protein